MSRPLRIEAGDHWYYVRNYSRKGADIFKQQADLDMFLALLTETCARYSIVCNSYTLLANEFHLLLYTEQANLAIFMRQLSGVYTQSYNKKYQLNGSLFKGRYQSSLIDPHFFPLQLSIFIHQHYLIHTSEDQPLTRSSCDHYLKALSPSAAKEKAEKAPSITISKIHHGFNQFYKKQSYQSIVLSELPHSVTLPLSKKHLPAIIGSYLFKEKYQQILENSSAECGALSSLQKTHCLQSKQNSQDIISYTANIFRLAKTNILQTQYGVNKCSDARNMAMYLCQLHTNMTLKEIAATFGINHYASVSNRISHFKKLLKEQESLQQNIQQINTLLRDQIVNDESLSNN